MTFCEDGWEEALRLQQLPDGVLFQEAGKTGHEQEKAWYARKETNHYETARGRADGNSMVAVTTC